MGELNRTGSTKQNFQEIPNIYCWQLSPEEGRGGTQAHKVE